MFRYLVFTKKVDITITGYNPFHFADASAETVSIFSNHASFSFSIELS